MTLGTAVVFDAVVVESDLDGVLSTAPAAANGRVTFTTATLSRAVHVVTLTATDEHGNIGSASVTLRMNGLPLAPTVRLAPADVTTVDDLVASIAADSIDPEDDAVTYRYDWSVDGSLSDVTGATVPASETSRGQLWIVIVTPNDGHADGDASIPLAVIIGNTAPSAPVVSIAPTPATAGNSLTCVVTTPSSDVDEDTIGYTLSWTVGGGAHDGAVATTTHAGDTVPGDMVLASQQWVCSAVAGDGSDTSAAATASIDVLGLSYVGQYNDLGTTAVVGDGFTFADPVFVSESTLWVFGVLAADANTDNLKLALYNSTISGTPGTIVATSEPFIASTGRTEVALIGPPVALPAGKYWLAWLSSGTFSLRRSLTCAGGVTTFGGADYPNFPIAFPSPSTTVNNICTNVYLGVR